MQDKKKLIILGVLALVILCVGVFQFSKSSGPAPTTAPSKPKATKSGVASTEPANNSAVTKNTVGLNGSPANAANPALGNAANANGVKPTQAVTAEADLPERDPFDGARYMAQVDTPKPGPNPAPPAATSITTGAKIKPMPLTGSLTTNDGKPVNLPMPTNAPAVPQRPDYTVSGVIVGDRPAAVFVDSKGNQRLIQLGGSLDGDTRVVSIRRGKVTVKSHGKTMTMTVGEDPTEKRSDEK